MRTLTFMLCIAISGCASTREKTDMCLANVSLLSKLDACSATRPASKLYDCRGDVFDNLAEPFAACFDRTGAKNLIEMRQHAVRQREISAIWLLFERGKISTFEREVLLNQVR